MEEKLYNLMQTVAKIEGKLEHLATKADLAEFIQDHMENCPLNAGKQGVNKSLVAVIATLASAVAGAVGYFVNQ